MAAAVTVQHAEAASRSGQGGVVEVSSFGAVPDDGKDDTRALKKALKACKETGATQLVFTPGQYDFHPDFAEEKYCFVSNNDEGLKRITFSLEGFKNLTIDGKGAAFMFHGFVNPFVLDRASNIRLENFSIDFSRTFHSEAIILGFDKGWMDVEVRNGFPFQVHRGMLLFTGGEGKSRPLTSVSKGDIYGSSHMLEFDTQKRETAYMVKDFYFKKIKGYPAKRLGGNKVRIMVPGLSGTPGNTMVFGPNHRRYPAIVISDSQEVHIKGVTIHHAGGMGILGQRSHNVSVTHCKVTPSNGRMLSTTADATHFVNNTGYLTLSHNLFENQKDDATNIHGIYVQVVEQSAKDTLIYQIKHHQQYGFDFLTPGKEVEFVRSKSMVTYGKAKVKSVHRINKQFTKVQFEEALPESIRVGDAMAEIRDYPEVTISHNMIRKNRARGMLLNCRGKTVVEHNTFHSPGAAILFEGDSFHWYEQGGVSDCVIRNNVFDNCMFGVWGKAVIDVKAGIKEDRETSRYNKNIRIEDNTFRVFDEGTLLNAYCVDGLVWRNNRVERTSAYPPRKGPFKKFKVEYSSNVEISE